MHNDAVVQGLSEAPFMKDVKRWGVLTIGTGLGNARFTNRDDSPCNIDLPPSRRPHTPKNHRGKGVKPAPFAYAKARRSIMRSNCWRTAKRGCSPAAKA